MHIKVHTHVLTTYLCLMPIVLHALAQKVSFLVMNLGNSQSFRRAVLPSSVVPWQGAENDCQDLGRVIDEDG